MKLAKIKVHKVNMGMKNPFTTSFGTEQERYFLVVEIQDEEGTVGWGECETFEQPFYTEEFTDGAWIMINKFLVPAIKNKEINHPDELEEFFAPYKRNNMAKAAIEGAVWDLYAKREGISLAKALGGERETIDVGVAFGVEEELVILLINIQEKIDEGYKRIKIKIKPGQDIEVVAAIREHFPDLPLMVDANSAYTLDDTEHLKQLDQYNLMMIEQPLAAGDLINHAKLQKELITPICLDESIQSVDEARKAIELDSCQIINVKISRVGGLSNARKIHDLCQDAGIPVWCGGMLEAGIGRAHSVAITSLANFTLPGDTAASNKYWERDIIDPEVMVENGVVHVPTSPGIGYEVNRKELEKYTTRTVQH